MSKHANRSFFRATSATNGFPAPPFDWRPACLCGKVFKPVRTKAEADLIVRRHAAAVPSGGEDEHGKSSEAT